MTKIPNRHNRRLRLRALALALALGSATTPVFAQALTPAFTYQGELRLASGPATASYDMQFRLFNAASDGAQIGSTVAANNVAVSGGLFSVPLNFGVAQFAGERQWLEIAIRPAGSGTFETLAPRTEVTAAPYAWSAAVALGNSVTTTSIVDGTIGTADVNTSQIQRRVTAFCPAGQYISVVRQDGTVTCGSDANAGGTVTSVATGAGLTGGPITATGTISVAAGGIGTTQINATQVQRRVGGTCAVGSYVRQVNEDGTVICGTDATGTDWSLTGNAGTNPATNFIGTTDNQPLELRTANVRSLRIEASSNTFGTPALPITTNTIGGGHANFVTGGVRGATIAGGGVPSGNSDPDFDSEGPNRVTDSYGTVGGGYNNQTGDAAGSTIDRPFATVGGGFLNTGSGFGSTVSGGFLNRASGERSIVAGGSSNLASGVSSTIGGGTGNIATGALSTVSGGDQNAARQVYSVVGGGSSNGASEFGSTVGGGISNFAIGSASTVGGGSLNGASGVYSTIGGGVNNCAGGFSSWAGGNRAKVRTDTSQPGSGCAGVASSGDADGDNGTFVWADSQSADFVSTGPNQFLVRAAGGFGLNTNSIPTGRFINTSTGAHLTSGGTWTNASSRALKTAFADVDAADVLSRVLQLGISTWSYRASEAGRHMGPIAEDFHALFGLGGDDASISTVDASGVALAAIQGLNAKVEAERDALQAENAELRAEQARLDAENDALRARLDRIEGMLVAPAATGAR